MSLLLSARHLRKSYVTGMGRCWARVQVLTSLSLSLDAGERVLILGPRASGKSTLLHCLVGLRRLDAGNVRWSGAHGAPYGLCIEPADVAGSTGGRSALVELPAEDIRAAEWMDALRLASCRDAGWLVLATRADALAPVAHRVLQLHEGMLRPAPERCPAQANASVLRVAETTAGRRRWRNRAPVTGAGIRD